MKAQRFTSLVRNQITTIIVIALLLGTVFWFTDAFINAYQNSPYDKIFTYFLEDFQSTSTMYSRIIALILLLIFGFISIISRNKLNKITKKLEKLVFLDTLTCCINRTPFFELLDKFILQSKRDNQILAVLFVDIDKFKQINDVYGHEIGDKILKATANKIIKNVRKSDFVGRVGGDEFVLCLNNIKSADNATRMAKKINDAFNEKIEIEDLQINLNVSIGISVYPEDGETSTELIKNSDFAMYKAKKMMNNTFQLFKTEFKKEYSMEQELLKALDNQEFFLHYQPIVDCKGTAVCLEALCRWNNSKLGNVSPSIFIPILEKNKGINKLGNWIFDKACRQITIINNNKKFQNLGVSVNISRIQMDKTDLVKDFDDILTKNAANRKNIYLEITEREKINNIKKIIDRLHELKKINIGYLLLDDFGSGYSSLTNLLQLPIDMVKIDRFLVHELNSGKFCNAVLDMICLIKKLNFKVVAEGVETKKEFDLLSKAGCDYFQGFYFSKPIPNISEVLKHNNGNFLP